MKMSGVLLAVQIIVNVSSRYFSLMFKKISILKLSIFLGLLALNHGRNFFVFRDDSIRYFIFVRYIESKSG